MIETRKEEEEEGGFPKRQGDWPRRISEKGRRATFLEDEGHLNSILGVAVRLREVFRKNFHTKVERSVVNTSTVVNKVVIADQDDIDARGI